MKKKLKLQNLGCVNCAMKMETEIKKLDGVQDASVNYMFQKLVIECDEDKFDSIFDSAKKICSNIEPDCVFIK